MKTLKETMETMKGAVMRTRIAYMLAGAGLILLGQALAPLLRPEATSQETDQTADHVHFTRITCNALDIIDSDGNRHVSLLSTEKGGIAAVWDIRGGLAAAVSADEHGGAVAARGTGNNSYASLRVEKEGGAVRLRGADGSDQLLAEATADGGGVSLYAADETLRGAWLALQIGAEMALLGKDGKRRVSLSVAPDDAGAARLYGAGGESVLVLPEL